MKWYRDGYKTAEETVLVIVNGPSTKHSDSMGKLATIFQAEVHQIGICTQMSIE